MSIFLSISALFSLISFLTTVLALIRVGSAAFLTNQPHHRAEFEVERPGVTSRAVLSQALAQMQVQVKGLGGYGQGMGMKGDGVGMGTELMRIPGGMNWSIRKGHPTRPRECSALHFLIVVLFFSDGRSFLFLSSVAAVPASATSVDG